MKNINPYRYNFKILSDFFARTLTLVIATTFFVSFLIQVTANILIAINLSPSTFSANFSVFSYPLIPAIAFFLFYSLGKRKSLSNSFKISIILLKFYLIISLILTSFALLFFILFSVFNGILPFISDIGFINNLQSAETIEHLQPFLLFYIYPFLFLSIVYFTSFLILLKNISKSLSSVYISKKGSSFFVFCSFLFSLLYIILALSNLQFFSFLPNNLTISGAFESFSSHLQSQPPATYYSETFIYSFTIITILNIINCIVLGLFAISYRKYILSLSNDINYSFNNKVAKYYFNDNNTSQVTNSHVNIIEFEKTSKAKNSSATHSYNFYVHEEPPVKTKNNNSKSFSPKPVFLISDFEKANNDSNQEPTNLSPNVESPINDIAVKKEETKFSADQSKQNDTDFSDVTTKKNIDLYDPINLKTTSIDEDHLLNLNPHKRNSNNEALSPIEYFITSKIPQKEDEFFNTRFSTDEYSSDI